MYNKSPFIVVAAYNSKKNSNVRHKSVVDYVCRGINDDEEIQKALDALPTGGGKVVLLEGTFNLSSQVSRAIDDVIIEGQGVATQLNLNGVTPVISVGNQSGWILRKFSTDAGDVDITDAVSPAVQDVWVNGTKIYGIIRTATKVVAAHDSSVQSKAQADYVCPGEDDQITIQKAIDALPTSGGEVKLLDGTFYIEASLVLDSYQTLKGCGRNTILTTTTADLDIITATGGAGTEKVGIIIADLCIDGNAGGVVNGIGITWVYVDYSRISNVWCINNGEDGIYIDYGDSNTIIDNICEGNGHSGIYFYSSTLNNVANNKCLGNTKKGIYLDTSCADNTIAENVCQGNTEEGILVEIDSDDNTISGNICKGNYTGINVESSNGCVVSSNTCQGNTTDGIYIDTSPNATITANTCRGNGDDGIVVSYLFDSLVSSNVCRGNAWWGIYIEESNNNTVTANVCHKNQHEGLYLYDAHHNVISANNCQTNSQVTDNTYSNISLDDSDYNLISSNLCRQGAEANQPNYGIRILNTCNKNIIQGNDLYDAGKTANFDDAGTLTIVIGNRGIEITQVRDLVMAKNTSGGGLVAGDAVVLKAVAAGNEITTTVAQGDDKVFGMVAETIANNASGLVLVKGKTTALKVDGTADIAIGDLLGTFTTAKIAMQAAAGDMAFAMALEAYATNDSDGVIDALIISPRKV